MKKGLRVTGIKGLPKEYKGEPLVLDIEITDEQGGKYESQLEMDKGFDRDKMLEAAVVIFKMCDATPVSVHIKSLRIKK